MNEDPIAEQPEQATEQNETPSAPPPPANPIRELRVMVYGLGFFVLLMSLALNLFIYKQNNKMQMELDLAKQTAGAIEANQVFQQNRAAMENLLREIANQTPAHPEATQILGRYNIRVQTQNAAPSAIPGIPPPPQ